MATEISVAHAQITYEAEAPFITEWIERQVEHWWLNDGREVDVRCNFHPVAARVSGADVGIE